MCMYIHTSSCTLCTDCVYSGVQEDENWGLSHTKAQHNFQLIVNVQQNQKWKTIIFQLVGAFCELAILQIGHSKSFRIWRIDYSSFLPFCDLDLSNMTLFNST